MTSNPYVGPRAFEDGETLYGRDREVVKLLNLLIAKRIVLLYSPSGAGKTSLVQAKLIPALMNEDFQVLPIIRVSLRSDPDHDFPAKTNRYVRRTLLSLEEDLPSEKQSSLADLTGTNLASYLEQRPQEGVEADGQVLIFDQFEEILTGDLTDHEEKEMFFTQLGEALRHRNRWALFAMREEYLAGLDPYLHLIPTRLRTTFRLDLLKKEEARQAMQKPADKQGVVFTNTAANKLIDDLRRKGPYIEPVQLQVVCYRLWENLQDNTMQIEEAHIENLGNVDSALADYYAKKVKSISADEKIKVSEWDIREWFEHQLITEQGGRNQVLEGKERSRGLENSAIELLVKAHLVRAEKRLNATWYELTHDRLIEPVQKNNADWFRKNETIIADMAEAVYESILDKQQAQMRHIFTRLVSVRDPDSYYTRKRRVLIKELVPEGSKLADTRSLLRALEVKRLLVLRKNTASNLEEAELSHEALIRYWPRLREWLDTELESQRLLYRIRQAAWEWKRRERDESFLVLQGSQLEEAEELLSKDPTKFPDLEQAYVEACVDLREREEQQQRKLEAAQNLAEEQRKRADAQARSSKSLRWLVRGLIVMFLVVVVVAIYALIQKWRAEDMAGVAEIAGSIAKQDRDIAKKAWQEGKRRLVNSQFINGINERDGNNNFLKASHYFMKAATLTDDPALSKNARLAGGFLIRAVHLGAILEHETAVKSALFNQDRRRVLTWSADNTARVWETESGRLLSSLKHPAPIFGAVFSHDMSGILTWSADGMVRVWETESGRLLSSLKHSAPIFGAVFSQNMRRVLTWGADGMARLWDTEKDTLAVSFPAHDGGINGSVVSQDGQRILTWSTDGYVRLWKTESGQLLSSLVHPQNVSGAVFSQDGRRVLTWSTDAYVRVWKTEKEESGTLISSLAHEQTVSGAAFSRDAKRIVTWGTDGMAQIWEVERKILISSLAHEQAVSGAVFRQNASQVLTWSGDNIARVWEADSGIQILTLPHSGIASEAAFSRDAARILTWSDDNLVQVWEIESDTLLSSFGDEDSVNSAVFSQDGRWVLTWGIDKSVRLWEADSGIRILSFLHDDTVSGAAFSPDAARVLTWNGEGTVQVWETEHGTRVSSFQADEKGINDAMLSQDARPGRWVLTWGSDNSVRLWEADSGTCILSFPHDDTVSGAAFSPDTARILTWDGDGAVRVWETEHGTRVSSFQANEGGIKGAVFSQDGRRILTWGVDSTARIWETDNGIHIVSLPHSAEVSGAVFSRDADRVLSWSEDGGIVRVWDTEGAPISSLNHNEVLGAKFNQDEHQVLTWGRDGTVRIWAIYNSQQLIPPLKYKEPINKASYSQDEHMVLIWSGYNTFHLWSLRTHYDEYLVLKLEAQTGTQLNDKGVVELLSLEDWQKKKELYKQKVEQRPISDYE